MKKNLVKSAAAVGLCLTMLVGGVSASAAYVNRDAGLPLGAEENPGYSQAEGRMVISEAGEYTLRGNMRGAVFVDPGAGDVKLILDGVRLDGGNGPAIVAVSGDRLDIELPDNSRNSMMGDPGAMIYSEIPVAFEGEGRLDLMDGEQDAIVVRGNDCSFNGADIRNLELPAMPDNDQQPGQMSGVPGDSQQPGQMPGAPSDSQQTGQMPDMPGDSQQSGQMPGMPGDSQQ